jgi:glutamyl-tRNA(Gln) amidotransferase subunit D
MDLSKNDIGYLLNIKKNENNKVYIYKGYLIDFNSNFIKIKLKQNGYNIEIKIDKNIIIEKTSEKIELGKIPKVKLKEKLNLSNIVYIGTGGTIGTHVDYNTGAVNMCRSPEEIISTTPELGNIVNIKRIESPFIKASEDIYYKDWINLSKSVYESITDNEIDGVIITHGTDTLSYTGTAISFMIENINKPVLLIGAQKSPDRASFDGSMNLICASYFIKEKVPGVFLVMHGSINDDFCYVHKANKSRKMHTSRRDAFKSINSLPIAKVYTNGKIEYLVDKNKIKILEEKPVLKNTFENKVALIKIYPNSNPKVIDWYIENRYKGFILEATGLGHIPIAMDSKNSYKFEENSWFPYLRDLNKKNKNLIFIMSSQCLFGRVNSRVYSNLRYASDSLGINFLDQHDMLPEVAYIKLGVALSLFNSKKEIIKYMKTNISGEITEKETPDSYEMSK